jgi:predicted ribosome quality control (RQC) complex YloA/Tae2 family protein
MKSLSGKKWTARELAEQFGCDVKTIANHARKLFGPGDERVTRLFDELQVTAILESMKQSQNPHAPGRKIGDSAETAENIIRSETELTLDFQIAQAEHEAAVFERKAKELWKARAIKAEIEKAESEKEKQVMATVDKWLIRGHQVLGEEAMKKYGGLPYWFDK